MTYPNTVISMPSNLFTLNDKFKACTNGSVYVGQVDTDPTVISNQIQAYIEQENGTLVPVDQPIKINAGGYLVDDNGQTQKFVLTNPEYSMTVLNSHGTQEFYFHKIYDFGAGVYHALTLVTKNYPTLQDAIEAQDLAEGMRVRVKERTTGNGGESVWEVTNDTSDGFGVVAAASGFSLTLVDNGRFVLLESLGAKDDIAFDSGPAINYGIQNYRYLTASAQRTFYTSEEIVPTDGTVLMALTSSNSTALDTLKFAKFPGSNFTGKAIVRASKLPIGSSLPDPISGAMLGPFEIDAEGADCGFYGRYLTNESRVYNVVVRNSNICNICVLTTWFAKYDGLTSMRANGKGVSLGYPLFGETGDLAVNGIEFEAVRSNYAGQSDANKAKWVDGVDVKQFALDGAGVIIATNACHFPSLQAEKGIGVGIVDVSAFDNSFGTIYTEGNCSQMTTGRADFVGKDSGSGKVVQAQTIFIGSTKDNAYYLEDNVLIDVGSVRRNSDHNTFFASGPQVIMRNGNSTVAANQDAGALAYEQFNCAAFFNVNLRYGSQLEDARFYSDVVLSFPYVVVVPRNSYSLSNDLALYIEPLDSTTARSFGTQFSAGSSYVVRYPSLNPGPHKISIAGTPPSSDFFCDIYVFERRPATGFNEIR